VVLQSFIILCLISVQWVLWGYSLAFGPDVGGIIGSLAWFGLNGVGYDPNPDYAATIPHQAFMLFQMMFAVITPALITGAYADRMKFSAFILFTLLWATFIYDPLAHWVWGVGGWVRNLGALDFAGGTVVHISSGISGLACALVDGCRVDLSRQTVGPGRGKRCGRGIGGHHASLGVRRPDLVDLDWDRSWCILLYCCDVETLVWL